MVVRKGGSKVKDGKTGLKCKQLVLQCVGFLTGSFLNKEGMIIQVLTSSSSS